MAYRNSLSDAQREQLASGADVASQQSARARVESAIRASFPEASPELVAKATDAALARQARVLRIACAS